MVGICAGLGREFEGNLEVGAWFGGKEGTRRWQVIMATAYRSNLSNAVLADISGAVFLCAYLAVMLAVGNTPLATAPRKLRDPRANRICAVSPASGTVH